MTTTATEVNPTAMELARQIAEMELEGYANLSQARRREMHHMWTLLQNALYPEGDSRAFAEAGDLVGLVRVEQANRGERPMPYTLPVPAVKA